jgi:hypothetical protein
MADLKPHPLVTALAKELVPKPKRGARKPDGTPVAPPTDKELATSLAQLSTAPELLTYAGYLGGVVPDKKTGNWVVLYLDAKLVTWLMVQEDGIVLRKEIDDKASPGGKRDVIWVKRDALVTKGITPPSPETRFLQGDLVRAGDFSASLTAPSLSPATGVFCEADTVGCCKKGTW